MGAPALAPPTPDSTPAAKALKPRSPMDIAMGAKADYEKAEAGGEEQHLTNQRQFLDTERRLSDREDALKPPELKQVPPPVAKTTSPQQEWSSAAMVLAALGSLLTRTPLTTAVNAAAAALKGFHEGDEEAFQTAFKSWQIANENADKMFEFQQKEYEAILGKIDRERNLNRQETEMRDREIDAEIRAKATAFRDDIAIAQLDQGGIKAFAELSNARERLNLARTVAADKVQGMQMFNDAWSQYQKGPEWRPKPGETPEQTEDRHLAKYSQIRQKTLGKDFFTPSQEASVADRNVKMLQAPGTPGAVWNTVANKMQTISQFKSGTAGTVPQSALADAFTQIINGGRAIRGFQMQMLTQDRAHIDTLLIEAQKVISGGGMLDKRMEDDMIRIATEVARNIDKQYRSSIERGVKRGQAMGIEDAPETFVPPDYDPDLIPGLTGETKLPDNLPPAPKENGKVLRSKKTGEIIAKSKNGQWEAYDGQ